MDVAFLTSWRGAFAVAGLVIVGITGAKLVVDPDAASRLAQVASASTSTSPYSGSVPSAEIMNRPLGAARPVVSLDYSLAELASLMAESMTISFETVNETAFVMRASGDDVLTQSPVEIAMHILIVDGRYVYSPVTLQPVGPALALEAMAYNRQEVSMNESVQFLIEMRTEILSRR